MATNTSLRHTQLKLSVQHLSSARRQRALHTLPRATKNKKNAQQPPEQQITSPVVDEEKDFWEGENWDFLGNVASWTIPIIALAAVGVGLFASQAYNSDADVYLKVATPVSDAIMVPANEVDK